MASRALAHPPSKGAPASVGAPLDLHEGIASRGCDRWPPALWLQSTLGDLVQGRCKAVNLCDYCARLAAVETSEVLALDAMTNSSPTLWSVLTTRTATLDVAAFQDARRSYRRAVKGRWSDAEMATLIEFQTGRGRNSGGKRRPHWNDMHKGIPASELDDLRDIGIWAWCKHVDATSGGQHFAEITATGGLMRYLALHFQKQDQTPPKGWRGHRFRTTRGYLAQPMEEAREQARQSLRLKRELRRLAGEGLAGQELEDAAHRALYEANELAWELVRVQPLPTAFNEDHEPIEWGDQMIVPVRR